MSSSRFRHIFIVAMLASLTFSVNASIQYVTDELIITMRSGQSNQHQVINTLKSGTAVEVLSTNTETGYSQIQIQNGIKGWVLSQYLITSPTARLSLIAAKEGLADNKQKQALLNQALDQSNKQIEQYKSHNKELNKNIDNLKRELSRIRNMAGHAPALSDENLHLKADLIRMETELQTYEQENIILRDRSARDWFIAGTGVALIGFTMGLLIHRIKNQKKSSWSEL